MKEFLSRLFWVFFLLAIISINSFAQKDFNPRAFFVEAESYFLFEEYSDALPLYQRILREEPQNYNVIYKIGVCYLNDPYQKSNSIKYLKEASDHINLKYKPNTFKEKQAPPEVFYYLGQAYRVNNKIDLAVESYGKFKKIVDPVEFDLDVVNSEIASCEVAKKSAKKAVYVQSKNLGEDINSRFAEINAILSGDGKTLVFTRELQFYDAIFISTLGEDGKWSPPYNLTPDFALDGNSYTTGISYNGDEVFVYRSDNFDGNIYSSKKKDKVWQPLEKLNLNINTKYWESHASISSDGQSLYFSSNRKGGYGGLDIYRSQKDPDGQWGVPVNLGPIVNSSFNDDTPFISPKDNKLFFSSLGHKGMGGYDIFVSEKIGPEQWSKPVNIGQPLNTTDDDMFFCPVKDQQSTGIYSHYDESSSYGLKDIYWIEVYNSILPRNYTLKGVVNVPSPELLAGGNIVISMVDNEAGKIVSQVTLDSLGEYSLEAPQGSYQLLIDGQGIKPASVPVDLVLTQDNDLVELALISVAAAAVGEGLIATTTSTVPELEVIGEKYIITDSVPIEIYLEVEEGSDLKVQTYVNDDLDNTEEYHVSKKNFSYLYTPKPGENKLIFTITDSEGNVNRQEVMVYYTPKIDEEPFVDIEVPAVQTALPEVALLATGGLQAYLLTLGAVSYDSKADLYEMLIANADANDYTIEEVNTLFALMLTQRDKDEFLSEYNKTDELNSYHLEDSVLSNLEMPYAIVADVKQPFAETPSTLNVGLTSLVPFEGEPMDELSYILSFSDEELIASEKFTGSSAEDVWNEISLFLSEDKANRTINLASTTQDLNFYYQNLVMSSNEELKALLVAIDFNKQGINNSIDLVNYLIEVAPNNNISLPELFNTLEAAQNKQNQNLHHFQESLALAATGELKTSIDEINISQKGINSFEQVIDELLKNAKTSGYSALEVYELLLKLIGIDKVDTLAIALSDNAYQDLDSLLRNVDLKQFSRPIELIQYLISQSSLYDYTESDINNLLLRMLLEKGIDNYLETEQVLQSKKLIKRRRITTTIVLANALLIVLILIFWRRSKNKRKE